MSLILAAEQAVGLAGLRSSEPASLSGVDSSSVMLQLARQKISSTTLLYQNRSIELPIEASSKDFILSSFVVSYLDDLHLFASECARIARPGGCLLISDMHPATAAEHEWKRSFHIDGVEIEIPVRSRVLSGNYLGLSDQGLIFKLIEPSFDLPQNELSSKRRQISSL